MTLERETDLEIKGEAFQKIGAILGSADEWDDPALYLEEIAGILNRAAKKLGMPPVSDQRGTSGREHWRTIADLHGIHYDED